MAGPLEVTLAEDWGVRLTGWALQTPAFPCLVMVHLCICYSQSMLMTGLPPQTPLSSTHTSLTFWIITLQSMTLVQFVYSLRSQSNIIATRDYSHFCRVHSLMNCWLHTTCPLLTLRMYRSILVMSMSIWSPPTHILATILLNWLPVHIRGLLGPYCMLHLGHVQTLHIQL